MNSKKNKDKDKKIDHLEYDKKNTAVNESFVEGSDYFYRDNEMMRTEIESAVKDKL